MTVIKMPKQSNGTVHSSKDLNQLIDYVRIRFWYFFWSYQKRIRTNLLPNRKHFRKPTKGTNRLTQDLKTSQKRNALLWQVRWPLRRLPARTHQK